QKGRKARDQTLAPLPGRLVAISWNYNPKRERFLITSRFPIPPLACAFFSPGATVTDCSCSKGSVEDKILVPKPFKNCTRCAKCGHPVNGHYCQGCALLREKIEEDLITYLKYFHDNSESSDDSTNVVNAPREPFVVKQNHGVNPPHIDKCCCECGEALDGIYCQQCICKSCGKGAHTGYNFPPKFPIISNPEPCNQTTNNELPQTLPSFDPPCYFEKEKSVPCVSKPNFVDEYSNIFNPPPQPPIYSCEFCGSNGQYGHYCTPQAPFNNPEPGYSQDLNFPQNIHNFQQHDDDSLYNENIKYVEASPHDSELVSLEVAEIVIPEVEKIKDDNLREKLLNVHLLIANIEALKDNPNPSSEFLTKSSFTSLKSFLEETNTFYNSVPEFENFCFDLGEISSGSTTTPSDISLPDYEAFYFDDDHIEEISSGSTTTHSGIFLSEYDLFIFDFANEEFADELAHIISPPEYDCFYFWNLPDPGELMSILNSEIRENLFTNSVDLPIEDDRSPLLAYVVWIFLAYLTYPVIPPYLYPFGNEDTIFDLSITINRFCSFKPSLSHR
nr:hypothetical protein [Tanacetum cinerariifolium]